MFAPKLHLFFPLEIYHFFVQWEVDKHILLPAPWFADILHKEVGYQKFELDTINPASSIPTERYMYLKKMKMYFTLSRSTDGVLLKLCSDMVARRFSKVFKYPYCVECKVEKDSPIFREIFDMAPGSFKLCIWDDPHPQATWIRFTVGFREQSDALMFQMKYA